MLEGCIDVLGVVDRGVVEGQGVKVWQLCEEGLAVNTRPYAAISDCQMLQARHAIGNGLQPTGTRWVTPFAEHQRMHWYWKTLPGLLQSLNLAAKLEKPDLHAIQ
jgi:hypothetical protein